MTTRCAVAALIRSLLGCSPRFFPLRELQVWAPSWAAGFRVVPAQREGLGEEPLAWEVVGGGGGSEDPEVASLVVFLSVRRDR